MTKSSENVISDIPANKNERDQENETTEATSKQSSNRERWILFIVAGIIILLDQASKNLVESSLALYTYYAPIPELENIFRITHISNTGVAFGLFQNGNTVFAIFAVIVAIAIIIYNFKLEPGHKLLRLALGLQVGGALGNLIDRTRQGYVTDFMDFGPWPVWNIADLAIVSGTILLVLIMFREEREEKRLAAEKSTEPQTETTAQQFDESSTS
jgi:signal peptidase II